MAKPLSTRQQFALHCLSTDAMRSVATFSAAVAERSCTYTTSQARAALDTLVRRGLATKHNDPVSLKAYYIAA